MYIHMLQVQHVKLLCYSSGCDYVLEIDMGSHPPISLCEN